MMLEDTPEFLGKAATRSAAASSVRTGNRGRLDEP
jgi:hypothetical protein